MVLDLEATVNVPYGSSEAALKIKDVNPLDPSVERKYYALGVGNVLTTDAEGSRQELVQVLVDGRGRQSPARLRQRRCDERQGGP